MSKKGFDISALMDDATPLQVTVPYSEEVNVTIKYVPRAVLARLMRNATKFIWDNKHQQQETFDAILFSKLLGAEAIAGWDGLLNGETPVPCTPENIETLMSKWTDFAKFVSTICTDLERMVAAGQESTAKNSATTSAQD